MRAPSDRNRMWQPPQIHVERPGPFWVGTHRSVPSVPSLHGTAFIFSRYSQLLRDEITRGSKTVNCGLVASSNTLRLALDQACRPDTIGGCIREPHSIRRWKCGWGGRSAPPGESPTGQAPLHPRSSEFRDDTQPTASCLPHLQSPHKQEQGRQSSSASLEGAQKRDELFAFLWVQIEAKPVPLNGTVSTPERPPAAGEVSVFQTIRIEHFFQACDRPVV
jgi:hypothetical protein